MIHVKFLLWNGQRYLLVSDDGQVWKLAWSYQRMKLNESGQHDLNYWRKKGVIIDEAEKEAQG